MDVRGVGRPLGRTWRMVDGDVRPEVAAPKLMVLEEVKVKSPGAGDLGILARVVMLGEFAREGYDIGVDSVDFEVVCCIECMEGIFEGDGETDARSYLEFVLGVKPTRFMDGECWKL